MDFETPHQLVPTWGKDSLQYALYLSLSRALSLSLSLSQTFLSFSGFSHVVGIKERTVSKDHIPRWQGRKGMHDIFNDTSIFLKTWERERERERCSILYIHLHYIHFVYIMSLYHNHGGKKKYTLRIGEIEFSWLLLWLTACHQD